MYQREVRRQLGIQSNAATTDWYVIREMKSILCNSLHEGLAKCSGLSRELTLLDADEVMAEVRAMFDPLDHSSIQDCFEDAFYKAEGDLKDAGGEPITVQKNLPSGAALPG